MACPQQPECRILVCGKTGVGKSSLINFLLGDDVCEVGDPGNSVVPQTKSVDCHSETKNGIKVTFYDSPGLEEGQVGDHEYLDAMSESCRDVDLVFYCHDMSTTRWTPAEISAIGPLTAKFGATFWDKAIIVLTRANMVQPARRATEQERKEHFQNWTTNLGRKLRTAVREQLEKIHAEDGDQPKVENGEIQKCVDSIPVVPVGSAATPVLPNEKNSIEDLRVTCTRKTGYQLCSSEPTLPPATSSPTRTEHYLRKICKWMIGGALLGAVVGRFISIYNIFILDIAVEAVVEIIFRYDIGVGEYILPALHSIGEVGRTIPMNSVVGAGVGTVIGNILGQLKCRLFKSSTH